MPYNTTSGQLPKSLSLTPDLWTQPDSPLDRQIDFIGKVGGGYDAAFAAGFLPCFDGVSERRCSNITDAAELTGNSSCHKTVERLLPMLWIMMERLTSTWFFGEEPSRQQYCISPKYSVTLLEAERGVTWQRI